MFDFGERTLERAVKDLVGEEFNPRDVASLEPIFPTGCSSSQGAFHLAKAVDQLTPEKDRLLDSGDDDDEETFKPVNEQDPSLSELEDPHWPPHRD